MRSSSPLDSILDYCWTDLLPRDWISCSNYSWLRWWGWIPGFSELSVFTKWALFLALTGLKFSSPPATRVRVGTPSLIFPFPFRFHNFFWIFIRAFSFHITRLLQFNFSISCSSFMHSSVEGGVQINFSSQRVLMVSFWLHHKVFNTVDWFSSLFSMNLVCANFSLC